MTALADAWLTICRFVVSKELTDGHKLPDAEEAHFSEQLAAFVEALASLAFERFTKIASSQTTLSNRTNILLGIVIVLRTKFPSAHLERLRSTELPYHAALVKELAREEQLKHAGVYANGQLLRQWFELLEEIGLCKASELVDDLIIAVKSNKRLVNFHACFVSWNYSFSIVSLDAQNATDATKMLVSLGRERGNSAELLTHQELSKCKRTPCDGMVAMSDEELKSIKETFASLQHYAQTLQAELQACSTVFGGEETTAIANTFYRLVEAANRCEDKCFLKASKLVEEVLSRGVASQSLLLAFFQ